MTPGVAPVLSWSRVSAPALVIGRSGVEARLDRVAVAEDGVVVVRRTSGGGPVLWDRHLLALDVALPRGHRLAVRDVVIAYRWLGEAIADALRTCGVGDVEVVDVDQARAARRRPGAARDACFGGISPFEVTAGGRKVVGLSQARRSQGALLQVGIPLRLDGARLGRLLGRGVDFARDLAAVAAGVEELVPGLEAGAIVAALEQAVAERCGVRLEEDVPSAGERNAIAAVVTEGLTGTPSGA